MSRACQGTEQQQRKVLTSASPGDCVPALGSGQRSGLVECGADIDTRVQHAGDGGGGDAAVGLGGGRDGNRGDRGIAGDRAGGLGNGDSQAG